MSLSKHQNKATSKTSNGAATETRGLRVLVVDDNRDAADSMAAMIGILGNEARATYSGYEVPAVAENFRPELVLLDIGMPGMNGYEVCRELRKAQGAAVRIVALTGYGQESDRTQAEAAGFDEHLVKPITLDSLQRVLGTVKP